jgi:hypothetical protein
MTPEDVAAIREPAALERYFVKTTLDPRRYESHYMKLSGNKAADNGFYYYYHARKASFAIRSNSNEPPTRIEGTVESPGTRVADHVLDHGPPNLNRGIVIDATGFRGGPIALIVAMALFGALAAWNLWKAVGRSFDPMQSPIAKKLRQSGDPIELARAIDMEMSRAHQTGNVITTDSWLMRKTTYGMILLNFEDVVWSYKTATKRYTNGIYTGTSYATTIHDRRRKTTNLQLKEPQTLQLLSAIGARVPWSLIGFDQALKKEWLKDAGKIIATVDERKREYLASAARVAPLPSGPPISGK